MSQANRFDEVSNFNVCVDVNPNTNKECVKVTATSVTADGQDLMRVVWYFDADAAESHALAMNHNAAVLRQRAQGKQQNSGP